MVCGKVCEGISEDFGGKYRLHLKLTILFVNLNHPKLRNLLFWWRLERLVFLGGGGKGNFGT